MTQRLAMWSGPRNISTALMRSWENRADCSVVDEPFYAAYLADTGLDHPCREQIMLTQSTDYGKVVEELTSHPCPTPLQYQKHMTHHIPRGMNMDWCSGMMHCFLIRDPREVVASYVKKMPVVDEDAIGIRRQHELFKQITGITGERPLVIDSGDVLADPEAILSALCKQLQLPFDAIAMLNWPRGRRDSDGIWASHWYHNVEQSTGFGESQASAPALQGGEQALAEAMRPYYEDMAALRLKG